MKSERIAEKFRLVILLFGTLITWQSVISNFIVFYRIERTLFKIENCVSPNPVVTPCFWGAVGFMVAFLWAYRRYIKKATREKYLVYFLAVCVAFEWFNFANELRGVVPVEGALIAPCPVTANPYTSACFYGSILFSLAFIATLLRIKRKVR